MGLRALLVGLCVFSLPHCFDAEVYEANIVAMKLDRPVMGGNLRRRCIASPPNHPWTYRWTHPSGEISTGSVLILNGLRTEDFGTYTCVAEAPGNFRLVAYDFVRADGTSLTRGGGSVGSDRSSQTRGGGGGGVGSVRSSQTQGGGGVGSDRSSQTRGGGGVGSDRSSQTRGGGGGVGSDRSSQTRGGGVGSDRSSQTQGGGGVGSQRAAGNYVQLRIRSAPGENLIPGGTVRRRCFVDRSGFSVSWTYPNGRVVQGEILTIENISPRDEGVYRCRATGRGVVLNGTFDLSFQGSQERQGSNSEVGSHFARIRIDILPGENFVHGGSIRRQCRVSDPGWTISWHYPDGRTVDSSYLWLNNLSRSHAGTYNCIARKNGAQLRVAFRIAFQETVQVVNIRTEPGENLVLGGSVRRRCSIGLPGWTKEWILPNGRRLYSDLLSLDNIGRRDEGNYVCLARAREGGRSANATFILRFEQASLPSNARIRIESLPGENFVYGGNVRRQCRVSDPGWTISWQYPDGRTVASSYLWLNNLSQRQAGTYNCIARKDGSQLRISFRIAFQESAGASARLEISGNSQTVQVGGPLRRECRISEAGWRTRWQLPNGRTLADPVLSIERLGPEHVGTYLCIAEKGTQRMQRSFEVQLTPGSGGGSEVARISLRTLQGENFVYGGTVRRQCTVSTPGWQIEWQYPNGRKVDSTFLWLNNLEEKDSGTYWCIATKNGRKLRLSFRIAFTSEQQTRYTGVKTVQITIAPRIEENLVLGGTIHRRCQATSGTWQVTWLDPRGRVISGKDLDLSQVQAAQLGRYKCVARARNGEEVMGQILIGNPSANSLNVRALTIEKLPSEQLRVGGVVQRRCLAPSGWNVHWQLPSGTVQAGDTLRIDNVAPTNAGAYMCVAEGPSGQLLKSSFRVTLIADTAPKYTTVRIQTLDGESLIVGGSVRKDCIVNSRNWDVHWTKPNGQRVSGRYLTLNNIQPRDSGRYECVARDRNSTRRLVAWFSFRLEETQLQTAEINVETLSGERLQPGGNLRRRCVVTQPGWTVYWTRPDGTRLDSDTLTINQLTPANSGRYICHARQQRTNARMSSWFTITIHANIGSFTNVDVNTLPGESLRIGGTIRRECVVTSPDWAVYWIKPDGSRLDSRFLTINGLQLSHSGRYTCFAENRSTGQKLNTWFTVNMAQNSGATLRIEELPGESLNAGGAVRKRCVSSQPGWTIFWLLPDGRRVNNTQLVIENLTARESGRYICRGEKSDGSRMETWFSFRIMQVAAIQMDTMPDEQLQLGGVLSQRCRMTQPGWRIRWELPNGSTVLTAHLRVTNLSQRHYGKYWCIATNPQTGETRRAWYKLGN